MVRIVCAELQLYHYSGKFSRQEIMINLNRSDGKTLHNRLLQQKQQLKIFFHQNYSVKHIFRIKYGICDGNQLFSLDILCLRICANRVMSESIDLLMSMNLIRLSRVHPKTRYSNLLTVIDFGWRLKRTQLCGTRQARSHRGGRVS